MLKYLEDGPDRVLKAMRYYRDQKTREVCVLPSTPVEGLTASLDPAL
jgi:hypothetical protein